MSKLIIIRGNSGSGKSTIAEHVRKKLNGKVALIGQDNLRRTILQEEDSIDKKDILGLLEQTVVYCMNQGYDVIVEGILSKPKYGDVLNRLMNQKNVTSFVFYIDVSFKETLKKHLIKENSHEFGEKEMRDWYQEKNYLGVKSEIIIEEESSLEETVEYVLSQTK